MKDKYLIRFDDICPTMNWSLWNQAEILLKRYNVKPLLGVVPDCKDPKLDIDSPNEDFWKWVVSKQNEGYAIAMHGVYHRYVTKARGIINNGFDSEFAGLSYTQQYEMIKYGKDLLLAKGVKTNIFFAPSHSYDYNTLKALSANGFKYLSDGKSHTPILRYGIICIPCKWNYKSKLFKDKYHTEVFHTNSWVTPNLYSGVEHLEKVCSEYNVVNWEDFVNRPYTQSVLAKIDEKLFVVLERNLFPFLRIIRRKFVNHGK